MPIRLRHTVAARPKSRARAGPRGVVGLIVLVAAAPCASCTLLSLDGLTGGAPDAGPSAHTDAGPADGSHTGSGSSDGAPPADVGYDDAGGSFCASQSP